MITSDQFFRMQWFIPWTVKYKNNLWMFSEIMLRNLERRQRWPTFERGRKVKVLVTQSGPILCDPMSCSPPGSSVHGIFQAGILEWVASPFSRGSSQPRNWTQVSCIAGRFFTVWNTREKRGHKESQRGRPCMWASPFRRILCSSREPNSECLFLLIWRLLQRTLM